MSDKVALAIQFMMSTFFHDKWRKSLGRVSVWFFESSRLERLADWGRTKPTRISGLTEVALGRTAKFEQPLPLDLLLLFARGTVCPSAILFARNAQLRKFLSGGH